LLRFGFSELSESELALQSAVRDFLAQELPKGTFRPGLGMAAPRDQEFSRKLASRGWIGMALPTKFGGGDRSAVERFLVVEELLRWGAPVGFHWVADRQTGPMLARFGSETQKQRFLPDICRGDVSFSIGMSEPDAGSDLAAVTTRATQVSGGWSLSGTKIWTGGAHVNDWFVVLCRTSDEGDRHAGLSQLIVDLHAPGLTARPIQYLDGQAFFCEVTLDDVFVPEEMVLGRLGDGWAQNTSELAFERAGPERWLSTYLLVEAFLRDSRADTVLARSLLGDAVAQWWAIRALSLSVARAIDAGQSPAAESSLVKERSAHGLSSRSWMPSGSWYRLSPTRRQTRRSSDCSRRRSWPRPRSRSAAARMRFCAPWPPERCWDERLAPRIASRWTGSGAGEPGAGRMGARRRRSTATGRSGDSCRLPGHPSGPLGQEGRLDHRAVRRRTEAGAAGLRGDRSRA
jgi:alkylation response protein AidB-like acyl-CoA dehydrogenase